MNTKTEERCLKVLIFGKMKNTVKLQGIYPVIFLKFCYDKSKQHYELSSCNKYLIKLMRYMKVYIIRLIIVMKSDIVIHENERYQYHDRYVQI